MELQKIQWTGNIREFRNVLERLIILCKDEITGNDVIAYARLYQEQLNKECHDQDSPTAVLAES
jgi:DNA-binding NtrC family response regulator